MTIEKGHDPLSNHIVRLSYDVLQPTEEVSPEEQRDEDVEVEQEESEERREGHD